VRELHGRKIGNGKPGPITKALQKSFFEIVRGEDKTHSSWLTRI
jgi:branched-chain amino acid aminotransferase